MRDPSVDGGYRQKDVLGAMGVLKVGLLKCAQGLGLEWGSLWKSDDRVKVEVKPRGRHRDISAGTNVLQLERQAVVAISGEAVVTTPATQLPKHDHHCRSLESGRSFVEEVCVEGFVDRRITDPAGDERAEVEELGFDPEIPELLIEGASSDIGHVLPTPAWALGHRPRSGARLFRWCRGRT